MTTVPSEEAIDAMALALQANGCTVIGNRGSVAGHLAPSMIRRVLATALVAGVEQLTPTTVRTCRVCGCTDDEACPGGCSWSQPAICSTCARRQEVADEEYLATLRAQQHAAERSAVAADEQAEAARMQREHLAGATWRFALSIAGERTTGSPTEDETVRAQIIEDARWFAHHLGNPPVEF